MRYPMPARKRVGVAYVFKERLALLPDGCILPSNLTLVNRFYNKYEDGRRGKVFWNKAGCSKSAMD